MPDRPEAQARQSIGKLLIDAGWLVQSRDETNVTAGRGGYEWFDLVGLEGDALEVRYRKTLETLGRESGRLGTIFRKAQNKIQSPALLRRLIADLIDREQWTTLDVDAKRRLRGLAREKRRRRKDGRGTILHSARLFAPLWT